MQVRSARLEDVPLLCEIYSHYVRETAVSFDCEVPSVENFRRSFESKTAHYPWLVGEDSEGRILGYASAYAHRTREAYQWSCESSIYLHPQSVGKGLGRRLYSVLFECLKRQGYFMVFAGTTLPNDASVRLHESMGFQKIGDFRRIGFKHEKWHDVGWFQLQLREGVPVEKPRPFHQIEKPTPLI